MAWTTFTTGPNGVGGYTEDITLNTSTSGVSFLGGALSEIGPDYSKANSYCVITAVLDDLAGTDLDVLLYGSYDAAGTDKFLLVDLADITAADTVSVKQVDLNAYPAPYYWIGTVPQASEDANVLTLRVIR